MHLHSLFSVLFLEVDCFRVFWPYSESSLAPIAQFIAHLRSLSQVTLSCTEPIALHFRLRWPPLAPGLLCFSASYAATPPLHIAKTSYSYSVQVLGFAPLNSSQTSSSATYSSLSLTDIFNSSGLWQALVAFDWCEFSIGKAGLSPLSLSFPIFQLIIYPLETPMRYPKTLRAQ